jgi:hypothetical protein
MTASFAAKPEVELAAAHARKRKLADSGIEAFSDGISHVENESIIAPNDFGNSHWIF